MQAETNVGLYSSSQSDLWTLARGVSMARGMEFMVELANLHTDIEARRRSFCKKFAEFIPWEETEDDEVKMLNSYQGLERLAILREQLMAAWRMPTTWDRQISLALPFSLALQGFHERFAQQPHLGKLTPYEPNVTSAAKTIGAILQTMLHADRLRFCANPGCHVQSYFFAERSTQKYCCEGCALPSQKAHKLAWWNEHGARTRKLASRKKRKLRNK